MLEDTLASPFLLLVLALLRSTCGCAAVRSGLDMTGQQLAQFEADVRIPKALANLQIAHSHLIVELGGLANLSR